MVLNQNEIKKNKTKGIVYYDPLYNYHHILRYKDNLIKMVILNPKTSHDVIKKDCLALIKKGFVIKNKDYLQKLKIDI